MKGLLNQYSEFLICIAFILSKLSDDDNAISLLKQTFQINHSKLQTTSHTNPIQTKTMAVIEEAKEAISITQEEEEEEVLEYENIFFTTGELPTATTNIGRVIATTSMNDQHQQAVDFFNFLQDENRQLLQLNADTVPRTAIICIPGLNYVKTVYGVSIGASGIGQNSPTDGKLLVLHGDGGIDIGTPHPFVLPLDTLDMREVGVMSDDQFRTAVTTAGADFHHPLLARHKVTNTESVFQIAPVPGFLVYDGLSRDLHAALLIERLDAIETDGIEMYSHLKHLLLACLTPHNLNHHKPYISQQHLLQMPVNQARIWATEKFGRLFPTLTQPNPAQLPQAPPAGNDNVAAILAQFLPLQQQVLDIQHRQRRHRFDDEEKKEEETISLGMSNQEIASTLIMCGKDPHSHHSVLPQWFQDCAEKGMTDSYRLRIIRKHIMLHYKYDDAEIPITATMLKNINKRNWLGKDGNIKRPSLLNASEGISPFVVLDLDEDEVAKINDTEDALTRASTVTMQDIASLKKKMTPKIPTTAEDFMLLLKRYANLLFALFSPDCPFYKCVVKVVDALKEFSRVARETMSQMTRASILWIILLQSRTFALGEDTILAEFTAMHSNLAAKQSIIYHAEVPQALLQSSTTPLSGKRKTNPKENEDKPEPKKPRQNLNNWHPTLKAKLATPMAKAGYPTFTTIMQYVDKDPNEIISDRSSWCTPNAFFGRCFLGEKCKRQHKMVTDTQAERIITMLDKFIQKPEDLKFKG